MQSLTNSGLPFPELHDTTIDEEVYYWCDEPLQFEGIFIPAKAMMDGFSIPKQAQGLFRKDPYYLPAAYVHDIPYKIGYYDELSRLQVDQLLRYWMHLYMDYRASQMLEGIESKPKAEQRKIRRAYRKRKISDFTKRQTVYYSVRAFGWRHYKKKTLKFAP